LELTENSGGVKRECMYGKHFERMYQGSMRGAGADVFAVWGYVISHVKGDSLVELNPEIIAFLIGMPEDRVRASIEWLTSPDAKSRNKEHEGRRLVRRGEFEYFVPSAAYYRGVKSPDDLREYNRMKQKESRERRRKLIAETAASPAASAVPEKKSVEAISPTWEAVKEIAAMRGVKFEVAKKFFDHYEDNNLWVNQHGLPINWMNKLKKWQETERQPKAGNSPSTIEDIATQDVNEALRAARKARNALKKKKDDA